VNRAFAPFAFLVLALALVGARVASSAPAAPADPPVMKIQPTVGDSIPPAEVKAINQALTDYLAALRQRDYVRAGGFIDRTTLLAQSESMLVQMAADSTKKAPTRRELFGVSTRDSLAARSTGEIFAAFMHYMDAANPGANATLTDASIQVLAARRMKGVVHVAYQLTLPPTRQRPEPYTQVTAQQMKWIDGQWKILVTE
jgi:hypothetical protein